MSIKKSIECKNIGMLGKFYIYIFSKYVKGINVS